MNHYDYPFNRPGYWNGCVPPNENGTVIVRSANARNGEDANGEEDVSSLRSSPSESSLFFYHTDHLGSTNLVTDRGRSICHAAEYLPYGEVFLEIKGSYDHLGTPFKFNGKEMDPETGMLYYGARYDMPKNGRIGLRPITSGIKYARRLYKAYKNTGYLEFEMTLRVLALLNCNCGIAGDVETIFDGDASTIDKSADAADIIIGTDFNHNVTNKTGSALRRIIGSVINYKSSNKQVTDIIEDAGIYDKNKAGTKFYRKNGGFIKATEDFNSMQLYNVHDIKTCPTTVKVNGTDKEGQSVILRNGSTDGFKPTIEVQEKKNGKSKSVYKIRYGK